MPNSPKSINMTIKTTETEEMVNLPTNIEGYGQLPLQAQRSHIVHFTLIGKHVYRISIISSYSQLSLRRTPLGPALSVRLREVSVL